MTSAAERPPRRVPRFVSCLVKGPLGCLAFAVGAGVVFVLLLPPAGGRMADAFLQERFGELHEGSLDIADAWIGSLYGAQRIDSITLRDPEDEEVLRASARAPELGPLLDAVLDGQPGSASYGPLVIEIASLRLVEGRDGRTNLERALAPRPRDEGSRSRRDGLQTDRELAVPLEVRVARLRWSDARGREGELLRLALTGELVWAPDETRLTLAGPTAVEGGDEGGGVRGRLEVVWRRAEGPGPAIVAFELENAPSALAAVACAAFRPLAAFAGPSVDKVEWARDGTRVELDVEDEGADLDVDGRLVEGDIAGDEAMLRLSIGCDDPRAGELLAHLVPVLEPPQCVGEPAAHELTLARCRWPLDGAWQRLAGELALAPAPSRAPLARALLAAGAAPGEPEIVVLDGVRARASVAAGMIEYAPLRLPTQSGWLELSGRVELATGELDGSLRGERAGVPVELGRWSGTRAELAPSAPEAPVVPGLPVPIAPAAPEPIEPREDGEAGDEG